MSKNTYATLCEACEEEFIGGFRALVYEGALKRVLKDVQGALKDAERDTAAAREYWLRMRLQADTDLGAGREPAEPKRSAGVGESRPSIMEAFKCPWKGCSESYASWKELDSHVQYTHLDAEEEPDFGP